MNEWLKAQIGFHFKLLNNWVNSLTQFHLLTNLYITHNL